MSNKHSFQAANVSMSEWIAYFTGSDSNCSSFSFDFFCFFFPFFLFLHFDLYVKRLTFGKKEKRNDRNCMSMAVTKIQWYPIVPIQFDQFVLKFVLKSFCLANRYILDLGFFSSLSNTISPLWNAYISLAHLHAQTYVSLLITHEHQVELSLFDNGAETERNKEAHYKRLPMHLCAIASIFRKKRRRKRYNVI